MGVFIFCGRERQNSVSLFFYSLHLENIPEKESTTEVVLQQHYMFVTFCWNIFESTEEAGTFAFYEMRPRMCRECSKRKSVWIIITQMIGELYAHSVLSKRTANGETTESIQKMRSTLCCHHRRTVRMISSPASGWFFGCQGNILSSITQEFHIILCYMMCIRITSLDMVVSSHKNYSETIQKFNFNYLWCHPVIKYKIK